MHKQIEYLHKVVSRQYRDTLKYQKECKSFHAFTLSEITSSGAGGGSPSRGCDVTGGVGLLVSAIVALNLSSRE